MSIMQLVNIDLCNHHHVLPTLLLLNLINA